MKKILFWILYVPLGLLMLIFGILQGIGEAGDNLLCRYEEWSFDYKCGE